MWIILSEFSSNPLACNLATNKWSRTLSLKTMPRLLKIVTKKVLNVSVTSLLLEIILYFLVTVALYYVNLLLQKRHNCFSKFLIVSDVLLLQVFKEIFAAWKVSVFSRIRNEYEEIRSISLYSVRMRGNTDQKKSKYGLFLFF